MHAPQDLLAPCRINGAAARGFLDANRVLICFSSWRISPSNSRVLEQKVLFSASICVQRCFRRIRSEGICILLVRVCFLTSGNIAGQTA